MPLDCINIVIIKTALGAAYFFTQQRKLFFDANVTVFTVHFPLFCEFSLFKALPTCDFFNILPAAKAKNHRLDRINTASAEINIAPYL